MSDPTPAGPEVMHDPDAVPAVVYVEFHGPDGEVLGPFPTEDQAHLDALKSIGWVELAPEKPDTEATVIYPANHDVDGETEAPEKTDLSRLTKAELQDYAAHMVPPVDLPDSMLHDDMVAAIEGTENPTASPAEQATTTDKAGS